MAAHDPVRVHPDERAEIDRAMGRWPGGAPVETVEPLGGLTNRTFKVTTVAGPVVVRLPGRGTHVYVDRDAELGNARIAAAMGVGAEILHTDPGALICAFIPGRVLSPTILRTEPGTLAGVARLLRLVHDGDRPFVSRFDPVAVISKHRDGLVDVPDGVDRLIEATARLDPPRRLTPCHGDPWPENFIDGRDRLHLVDWEYSGMNEPAWDLADLAVESDLGPRHREQLLDAYDGVEPDPDLRPRVEALGAVTDLLWGLWALTQERDGNEAEDFGAYGRRRLDRAARALA